MNSEESVIEAFEALNKILEEEGELKMCDNVQEDNTNSSQDAEFTPEESPVAAPAGADPYIEYPNVSDIVNKTIQISASGKTITQYEQQVAELDDKLSEAHNNARQAIRHTMSTPPWTFPRGIGSMGTGPPPPPRTSAIHKESSNIDEEIQREAVNEYNSRIRKLKLMQEKDRMEDPAESLKSAFDQDETAFRERPVDGPGFTIFGNRAKPFESDEFAVSSTPETPLHCCAIGEILERVCNDAAILQNLLDPILAPATDQQVENVDDYGSITKNQAMQIYNLLENITKRLEL